VWNSVGSGSLWKFYRNFHRFFCGYGMGMGIEIQFPRQPCICHDVARTETLNVQVGLNAKKLCILIVKQLNELYV